MAEAGHLWSKVGAEFRCCHSLTGCAHTWGNADMPAPCHLGPLWTLGTDKRRRKAKWGQGAAWCWPEGTLGTMNGSRRQTGSWVEGGSSLVRRPLQARKGLKAGGKAASPVNWSGELTVPFSGLPMASLGPTGTACTSSPLRPIKAPGSARAEQMLGRPPADRSNLLQDPLFAESCRDDGAMTGR